MKIFIEFYLFINFFLLGLKKFIGFFNSNIIFKSFIIM